MLSNEHLPGQISQVKIITKYTWLVLKMTPVWLLPPPENRNMMMMMMRADLWVDLQWLPAPPAKVVCPYIDPKPESHYPLPKITTALTVIRVADAIVGMIQQNSSL